MVSCSSCKTVLPSNTKFCTNCGHYLSNGSNSSSSSASSPLSPSVTPKSQVKSSSPASNPLRPGRGPITETVFCKKCGDPMKDGKICVKNCQMEGEVSSPQVESKTSHSVVKSSFNSMKVTPTTPVVNNTASNFKSKEAPAAPSSPKTLGRTVASSNSNSSSNSASPSWKTSNSSTTKSGFNSNSNQNSSSPSSIFSKNTTNSSSPLNNSNTSSPSVSNFSNATPPPPKTNRPEGSKPAINTNSTPSFASPSSSTSTPPPPKTNRPEGSKPAVSPTHSWTSAAPALTSTTTTPPPPKTTRPEGSKPAVNTNTKPQSEPSPQTPNYTATVAPPPPKTNRPEGSKPAIGSASAVSSPPPSNSQLQPPSKQTQVPALKVSGKMPPPEPPTRLSPRSLSIKTANFNGTPTSPTPTVTSPPVSPNNLSLRSSNNKIPPEVPPPPTKAPPKAPPNSRQKPPAPPPKPPKKTATVVSIQAANDVQGTSSGFAKENQPVNAIRDRSMRISGSPLTAAGKPPVPPPPSNLSTAPKDDNETSPPINERSHSNSVSGPIKKNSTFRGLKNLLFRGEEKDIKAEPDVITSNSNDADLLRLKEENEQLRKQLEMMKTSPQQTSVQSPMSSPPVISPPPAVEVEKRAWRTKYESMKSGNLNTSYKGPLQSSGGSDSSKENSTSDVVVLSDNRKKPKADLSSLSPRDRVIRELVDTEEDYVKDLETIISEFMNPLQNDKLISKEDITGIFSNVTLILGVNKMLLQELQEGNNPVGNIFMKMAEYLKVYSLYCSNQPNSIAITTRLMSKDKKFNNFIAYSLAKPSTGGIDFNSYMIKPIQRICKYPLLLRELRNKTEQSHPEYVELEKAQSKIDEIVGGINEKKRDNESLQRTFEVSKELEDPSLISPTRKHVWDGEVEYTKEKGGKMKDGWVFLFNDLFLLTKKNGHKHATVLGLPLSRAEIRYLPMQGTVGIEVFEKSDSSTKFQLSFNDTQAANIITECLDNYHKKENLDSYEDSYQGSIAGSLTEISAHSSTMHEDDSALTTPRDSTSIITFECNYHEVQTFNLERDNCTFDVLYWSVADLYGVEALTLMNGEEFVYEQSDLDRMLSDGSNYYCLNVYDPW